MAEELIALVGAEVMGTVRYARDRISFRYDDGWRENPAAFPLSLSMPLVQSEHEDAVVRPFLWGLLPDNDDVLRHWGRRFQVSARNPFRLLRHIGEDCAGAVQFVPPEIASDWGNGSAPGGIDWIGEAELIERIDELVTDHASARRLGDEGHFSLAGAQPKTGLIRDLESGRWGIPKGSTPTTHILKPNTGAFGGQDLNEHLCLQIARGLGLDTCRSSISKIGEIDVIVVERYDRRRLPDGRWIRIHQEDTCQALGRSPDTKYQNQGGPSANDVFGLIQSRSSRASEDTNAFLRAMVFNWLISGTDAHGKNFGFLIAGRGQVRLAPLYDVASALPYPRQIPPRKAKLAMKIGGQYVHQRIGGREWRKAAEEWRIPAESIIEAISEMASAIPDAVQQAVERLPDPEAPLALDLADRLQQAAAAARKVIVS